MVSSQRLAFVSCVHGARSFSSRPRIPLLSMKRSELPPYPVRFGIIGGGAFALAMGSVLARNSIPSTLLVRNETVAASINTLHMHPVYLSDIRLPNHIQATTDPTEALFDATHIIHSIPVQASRVFLQQHAHYLPPHAPVLSVSKGVEISSFSLMTEVLTETLGPDRPLAFLSGPSFAREIAEGLATGVVVASKDGKLRNEFADLMSSDTFRVFTSHDVTGVEIGGAVKNVIALSAGMCQGLGLGTNAMAALVTRGCNEMVRLGELFGASRSTLSGLSGVGDTFGTCFGPLSRNRMVGYRLGKGETLDEILATSNGVAEGVPTAFALERYIKEKVPGYRVDLKFPIIFGVASILRGELSPKEGLTYLMKFPLRPEFYC